MAVAAVNLTIEKGANFSTPLKLKTDGSTINLTGYTFSCKMRKHPAASTYYTFIVTALIPLTAGVVKLEMSDITTSSIPPGRYIWDLMITLSGITTKAVKGTVIVEGSAS